MSNIVNTNQVSVADYQDAVDSYTGWCVSCKEFTTSCVEPDAEHYECEECSKSTVYGAEQAMMLGLIDLKEDEGTS